MGPVSSVRPSVQWLETPPPSAGIEPGSPAARHGTRAEFTAPLETSRTVAPATGPAPSDAAQERRGQERWGQERRAPDTPAPAQSFAVETARARAVAAQRAYTMASLVAGLNPLICPALQGVAVP